VAISYKENMKAEKAMLISRDWVW